MSIQTSSKIQKLLREWPHGVVGTAEWLLSNGISRGLLEKYKNSGWISGLGGGAYYKPQDKIDWAGGLFALQKQLNLAIHVGGKTSLELQGHGHFIMVGKPNVDLLKHSKTHIPKWFSHYEWAENTRIIQLEILPKNIGLEEIMVKNIPIYVSSRERAVLELLHLTPYVYDFEETRLIMESMGTLRPELLFELLCVCSSEKAKRLILYFGDFQGHNWFKHIDQKKIKVSSSLIKIVNKNGRYNSKYNLFLPVEYIIKEEEDVKF